MRKLYTPVVSIVYFAAFLFSQFTNSAFAGIKRIHNTTGGVPTNITIGILGDYTSLTNAGGLFADINNKGLAGNTTVTIVDPTVVETAANALEQMTYTGGGPYTLTIKPAALGTVLTGAISNGALLRIMSSNVVIDGSKNGTSSRDLSILNTSVTQPFVFLLGSTGTTPISNVTIRNCIVANGINTSSAIVLSDGTMPGAAGYFNNINFENNDVQNAYIGIYCVGDGSPGNGNGLNIISNKLNTSGVSAIKNVGIYVQGVDGALISGNDVGNFESASPELDLGIALAVGTTNTKIDKNLIHDITYTGSGGYGGKGITIATGVAAANITISNNMLYHITGDGNSYTTYGAYYCPVGIYALGPNQGGINIYDNSIYLSGATLSSSDAYSFGIALDNNSAADVKDNIVYNQLGLLSATGVGAVCIAAQTSSSQFTALDYNDYYSNVTLGANLVGKVGNTDYSTLEAWQLATGTEANSLNVLPYFTSATDLHLVAAANCALDGYGTPVPGVATDYDAQLRDMTTPDMGADEFTSSYSGSLAGVSGSVTCENKMISTSGTSYASSSCGLIAKVLPSGSAPVTGKINTCVTVDASQQYFNGEPYVKRHFDIEPATANPTTTTATITLYFSDTDFVNFNTLNPSWPPLPTVAGGGNADPNRANLKITQYHGTATTNPPTPGNYTANSGGGVLINPADANIVWNGSYWAVTFDITGFSGFYVHSNPLDPLPVSINYLNGTKQGNDHLLTWSVTCNSTPRVTLTLERSPDSRNFSNIYSITADAARCNQPFDHTDAQPLAGINYYRLKIVGADGKITYSNIIALINGTKGFALMNIAPNPVRGNSFKLNVTAATAIKLELVISDMQGRIVNRQSILLTAGFNSIDMNATNLAPGTYNIYGITADDKSGLIRFVKQ